MDDNRQQPPGFDPRQRREPSQVIRRDPGYRPPWMELSAATQISLPKLGPADSLAVVRSVLRREDVPEALSGLGPPVVGDRSGMQA